MMSQKNDGGDMIAQKFFISFEIMTKFSQTSSHNFLSIKCELNFGP